MNLASEPDLLLTEEDRCRIMNLAEIVLADLERQIAKPISVVWGLSLNGLQEYIKRCEWNIIYWRKLLPGSSEIGRSIFLGFIELAKKEIEEGESVLFSLGKAKD